MKNAFFDPVTMILKCHGFVDANEPGDVVVNVHDDFSLLPGEARLINGSIEPVSPAPDIPSVVTMRQARAALILNGLEEAVDAAVRAIPGIEGKLAVNDWDRATELRRDHPLVRALTPALGLTSEQLDALFVQASKL